MVARVRPSRTADDSYYDELHEHWPTDRPGRGRRAKRDRHVKVTATRRDKPDVARVSKALLTAQRELAGALAEAEARSQAGEEYQHEQ